MDLVHRAPGGDARVAERATSDTTAVLVARNYWALASSAMAAAMLPLWGFFVLSTLTWQNPLLGQANFNLLSPSGINFISANSLNLALVIAALIMVPLAFLALALLNEPEPMRPLEDRWVQIALALNALTVLAIVITVFPLFGY